jgi:maltose alpha-D-glucosyltransferase/alpha-amylase
MKKSKEILPYQADPLWYKDAIIYELHVRSFFDSDADGIGDFRGLIEKLDYLEDLGVNAIWLLPFYPSPLKDDGYDISDYYGILPAYGAMTDFQAFVKEAHRHGLRIITELVVNHTSDQHPWFQEARRAPAGSTARDYYVWSDSPEKYKEARIIFKDYEHSNWTWDFLAKAYYWHRFYSHQPDLNYDNPMVQKNMLKVLDYWLRQGVDGLRADAVPYLFEREGTSSENLPETHAFLKQLRAHVDRKFTNRMLLAEANQWPEDAALYFGNGDEFHMAFHFPIMPRLFMAIRMEDRFPIVDILRQTPAIPDTSQWAIFLRNHDELTLEMVTDEERDYMYRVYASDPAARLNLGIRRRLAPLLNNDRKKIELMNILLFSLPGTPVIYYGDEIGMGDNFYLGDRNGVRTPMQWSPERNAGFSRANPQRLYLPPVVDPEYHYEAINVDNQQANADSLLWWMKHVIALRKNFQAFGRGTIEFLQPQNRRILAFFRRYQQETILVVANLSHLAQQTRIDLPGLDGWRPVDLFGRGEFLPVQGENYYFTLSPYSFFWFLLQPNPAQANILPSAPKAETIAVPKLALGGEELFEKQNWPVLEATLQEFIKKRRWFRGKARVIRSVEVVDVVPSRFAESEGYFVLLRVEYVDGEPEIYSIPLSVGVGAAPESCLVRLQVGAGGEEPMLCDGMLDKSFCRTILANIGRRHHFKGRAGEIEATVTRAFRSLRGPDNAVLEPEVVKAEQTNTSVVYGNRLILKLFRQLDQGVNPELEIGRFLTEKTSFSHVSPLAGALEYYDAKGGLTSLGVLQGFVPNEGDAWHYTQDSLDNYFRSVLSHATVQLPPVPRQHLLSLMREPPSLAKETIGSYLLSVELLGRRTAEMHLALASVPDDPDFAPEQFSFMYQTSLYQSMRSYTLRILQMLRENLRSLPAAVKEDAERVIDLEKPIIERYQLIRKRKISAVRIRCHGDYHLGQVLYTGKDFVIIDFEGEPARPLSERRLKKSPLQDVAGLVRSFHYAAHTALLRQAPMGTQSGNELPTLRQWTQFWYLWVSVTFVKSYLEAVEQGSLVPDDAEQLRALLDAHMLEKAVYEIGYEMNNRPDWVSVPLQGVMQIMEIGQ